jgi:type I restriction enzyme M protein
MTEEIRKHDHVLTPGRYVGATEVDDSNDEPIADKIARLTKDLYALFDESARLEQEVRTQLERLDV